MGTIKKGILGGISGKVGNVVGGIWKGITYLRSLPTGGTDTGTEAQLQQRLKFKTVTQFIRPLMPAIRIGFKPAAVKMSAYNAAFSYFYHEAVTGEYPTFSIDYEKVLISLGYLPGSVFVGCEAPDPGKIEVSWDPEANTDVALSTDVVMLALINEETDYTVTVLDAATRAVGAVSVTLPAIYTGDTFHCYISFRSKVPSLYQSSSYDTISNSQYAGSVVLL